MERQPEGKQRLAGRAATEPGQDPEAGRPNARPATPPGLGPIARAGSQADLQALLRIFERCHVWVDAASKASSVPPAFLGALTANESAGSRTAARFEPAVYRHLQAVACGQAPAYGSIGARDLDQAIQDRLHPKAAEYHARYLTSPFGASHGPAIGSLADDVLRELSTSWVFTQIMGYHVMGRSGNVRDLLEPEYHYRLAIELLAEFAQDYHLDLAREPEELFRCWNTGQPYGKTYDPAYVANGLRRISLHQEIALRAKSAPREGN